MVKSNFSSHSIVDLKEMVFKNSPKPRFELEYFEIAQKELKTDNSKKEGDLPGLYSSCR